MAMLPHEGVGMPRGLKTQYFGSSAHCQMRQYKVAANESEHAHSDDSRNSATALMGE